MSEFFARDKGSGLSGLPIKPGDRVLDMCAAPGGKALTLLFRANSSNHFALNERSETRRVNVVLAVQSNPSDGKAGQLWPSIQEISPGGLSMLHSKNAP